MWTSPPSEWKLDELAAQAGVSPRTVRYYVQRGLLPAPTFRGRDTSYGAEHLLRLRAIRRLQERFLPLDAIEVELKRLTPEQVRQLAEGHEVPMTLQVHASVGPRQPPTVPASVPANVWERWELLPGLELHLSAQAGPATRAVAEALRQQVQEEGFSKGRKP